MRPGRFGASLMLWFVALLPSARADEPAPVRAQPPPVSLETVRALLATRSELERNGEEEKADKELQKIIDLARELRAKNVPLASVVLIEDARSALAQGRSERAALFADAAARLSPQMGAAHWMRAETLLKNNLSFWQALLAAFDAIGTRFSGFRNQVAFVLESAFVLWLSGLITIALFALISVLKYVRYAAYDIERYTPLTAAQAWSLGLLALMAPVVLGVGAIPALLVWLVLAGAYQNEAEVSATTGAFVFIGVTPLILYFIAGLLAFNGSPSDTLAVAAEEVMSQGDEALLLDLKDDSDAAFLLGTRFRQLGRLSTAKRWLEKSVELDPDRSAVHNNLGNVQYGLGDFSEAEAEYRLALQRGAIEPRLNLAALLIDRGREAEGKEVLSQAWDIDTEMTQAFQERKGGAYRTLDMSFDEGRLWGRLFEDQAHVGAVRGQLWERVGGRIPHFIVPFAAVFFGLLVLWIRRPSIRLSSPCMRCAKPGDRAREQKLCDECAEAFGVSTLPGEQDKRIRREELISATELRRKLIRRGLSLVSGAGHYYDGRPIVGLALSFILALAVVNFFWSDIFSVHTWSLWKGPPFVRISYTVPIVVVVTMVSIRMAFTRER